MNLTLKPIDRYNYEDCLALRVNSAQASFVAPNILSLVQAAYEPDMYPLAIYREKTMIGFLLYDFDTEINAWSMSRLMVDSQYQNQGLGSQTLQLFLQLFRNKYGAVPLYTSAAVDNAAAIRLYEKYGFQRRDIFSYEIDGIVHTEVRMLLEQS